jgi:CheY-like chemotaxis protein
MSHLLLVDDDPDVRLVLAAGLTAAGLDVITAGTGDEALQTLMDHGDVDLVFLTLPWSVWTARIFWLKHGSSVRASQG